MISVSDVEPSTIAWLGTFATAIGVEPPSERDIDTLLRLAGVAAHASARQAAPVACWLAARAGLEPAQALTIATGLAGPGSGDGTG